MAGLAAVPHGGGTLRDRPEIAQRAAPLCVAALGLAPSAAPRQQPPGPLGQAPAAGRVIAGPVDRLRADPGALAAKQRADRVRRHPVREQRADRTGQHGIRSELGRLGPARPSRGRGMRRLGVIAGAAAIARQLAMNRRGIPLQAPRRLSHTHACCDHRLDARAFIAAESLCHTWEPPPDRMLCCNRPSWPITCIHRWRSPPFQHRVTPSGRCQGPVVPRGGPPLYLVEWLWRGSVGAGCSPRRVGLYPPVT